MIYALVFLMVFSCNAYNEQFYFEETDEVVQIDDFEKTNSILNWLQLMVVAGFLYDSVSIKNGQFFFTPTSTLFKWTGKSCSFIARILYFCNL